MHLGTLAYLILTTVSYLIPEFSLTRFLLSLKTNLFVHKSSFKYKGHSNVIWTLVRVNLQSSDMEGGGDDHASEVVCQGSIK